MRAEIEHDERGTEPSAASLCHWTELGAPFWRAGYGSTS